MPSMARYFVCAAIAAVLAFSSIDSAYAQQELSMESSTGQTFNVRVSPLGLLIGSVNLGVDFEVAPSWTVGPEASFWNLSIGDYDISAYGFGVRANYFFGRPVFTQGWYIGPFASYASVEVVDNDYTASGLKAEGSADGFGAGALAGYQWKWENFNINLGLGFSVSSVARVKIRTSTGEEETVGSRTLGGLNGEFSLGWAF